MIAEKETACPAGKDCFCAYAVFLQKFEKTWFYPFTNHLKCDNINVVRGISAAGSAQHWQCWGQEFESPMLHQTQEIRTSSRLGMGSDFFFLSQVLWRDKQNERKETDRNHSDSCRKYFITDTTGTVKYYAQIHLQVWQNSVCTGQGNLPLIT